MKDRTWMALVSGVAMVSFGTPALASTLAGDDPSETASPSAAPWSLDFSSNQSDGADVTGTDETSDRADAIASAGDALLDADQNIAAKAEKPAKGHGHGPPPWAHATGDKNKGSLDAWKTLTPEQRVTKMAALIRAHSAGMKKWAHCRAAGRNDCVRPLPPGLAKRG